MKLLVPDLSLGMADQLRNCSVRLPDFALDLAPNGEILSLIRKVSALCSLRLAKRDLLTPHLLCSSTSLVPCRSRLLDITPPSSSTSLRGCTLAGFSTGKSSRRSCLHRWRLRLTMISCFRAIVVI